MDIDMVYQNGFGNSCYDFITHKIEINLSCLKDDTKTLTDDDSIILISSCIEHEVIHAVLHKYVSLRACLYFDLIARNLRVYNFPSTDYFFSKIGLTFLTHENLIKRIKDFIEWNNDRTDLDSKA